MADMINKKMSKRERKAIRRNIPWADSPNMADYCVDTSLDVVIKYGTNYPKHDKNDYTTPMRAYKK